MIKFIFSANFSASLPNLNFYKYFKIKLKEKSIHLEVLYFIDKFLKFISSASYDLTRSVNFF